MKTAREKRESLEVVASLGIESSMREFSHLRKCACRRM